MFEFVKWMSSCIQLLHVSWCICSNKSPIKTHYYSSWIFLRFAIVINRKDAFEYVKISRDEIGKVLIEKKHLRIRVSFTTEILFIIPYRSDRRDDKSNKYPTDPRVISTPSEFQTQPWRHQAPSNHLSFTHHS